MSEDTIKERCNKLKRHKNDLNNYYLCIESLKNNFMNSYDMVEKILDTITFHIDQLEYRVEQLELDRKHEINSVKFLGTYRDWITIFINEVTDRLDKGDWKLVKKSLIRLSNNLKLTEQQDKCLKELGSLLEGVGMSLNDMELLRQMKDHSNIKFHSNNQSFDQVKSLLHIPIPDEMNQYKPSLQKALEAIYKWNPSITTRDAIYFSDQK